MRTYKQDFPILLGLAGTTGVGRTTVARALSPAVQFHVNSDPKQETQTLKLLSSGLNFHSNKTIWRHNSFTAPLNEIVSIVRNVEGVARKERILYQVHDKLCQVLGSNPLHGAPNYGELVSFTENVANAPVPSEGPATKFVAELRERCEELHPGCLTTYARQHIYADYFRSRKEFFRDQELSQALDPDYPEYNFIYISIISDMNTPAEADMVHNEPNGITLHFDIEKEQLVERLGPDYLRSYPEVLNSSPALSSDMLEGSIPVGSLDIKDQILATRDYLHNSFDIFAAERTANKGAQV